MYKEKQYQRSSIIYLQDVVLSLLASLLAILVVRWVSDPRPGFTLLVAKWLVTSAVAIQAGLLISKSYKDVRRYATLRSMGKSLLSLLIKELILTIIILFGFFGFSLAESVLILTLDFLLTSLLLAYIRMSARLLIRDNGSFQAKALSRSALVVGTDDMALALAAQLEKEGYSIAGLLTTDRNMAGRVIHDYVVYWCDDRESLRRLQWRLGGVDSLFFPKNADKELFAGDKPEEDIPHQDGMSLGGHMVKRGFDIGLSAFLLLLFSPVIGLCALAVKLEDGGPAIYSQERIGRGGIPFQIYKFRSMRVDAESGGSPALYSGEEDPRLTKVGRFLRTHHLDELPQLWNVLKGDMSFIGYRPERQYYIDQIMQCNARYRYLFQIRPGVTSYATLYNGYTDSLSKMLTRLDLDLYYLRNHSIWFDLKVLGLSFLGIVSGKKF